MKTDDSAKKIMLLIIIILTALLCFVLNSKKSTVIAQSTNPEMDMRVQLLSERENCQRLTETIHAYNLVLHRIWIDKPSYVEDVLNECDEYCTLSNLLSPEDEKEIYTFYDERDSIDYYLNMDIMDCILGDPGCDIPSHTQKSLDKVFKPSSSGKR